MKYRGNRGINLKIQALFYNNKEVGTATWNKKNATVKIEYKDDFTFPERVLDFDEVDEYLKSMNLVKESELGQLNFDMFGD